MLAAMAAAQTTSNSSLKIGGTNFVTIFSSSVERILFGAGVLASAADVQRERFPVDLNCD
jgi:hypothetical protein